MSFRTLVASSFLCLACGGGTSDDHVEDALARTLIDSGVDGTAVDATLGAEADANTCPTLSPPSPNFCPNGKIVPDTDANGCVRGYDCVTCPALSPPSPNFCPNGKIVPDTDANGCVRGYDCVTCPTLSPPGPNFCPNGTIVPKKDANGCITGYDCVKP